MTAVLGIGNATLDIIHQVDCYPNENDEIRCSSRLRRCGGNTANTLIVLSQLGLDCGWAGTLVADADGRLVADALNRHGVDITAAQWFDSGCMPVSSVLLSKQTGSRTITHFRDLPEYPLAAFKSLDLQSYDWLHFEGRNVASVSQMLASVRQRTTQLRCSLEVEKPREDIESLFPLVDVLLFSRHYALSRGFTDPLALLRSVHTMCPGVDLFCAWGEQGAVALGHAGNECRHAAVIPPRVVDTLGAGDTFNAGIINGYLKALGIDESLALACQLAGNKCGQDGLAGLTR
jgi:ketohexokinase